MNDWWQIVSVTLICTIKFIIGLGMALAYNFKPVVFYLTTVGGGMLGVFIYLYLWDFILLIKKKIVKPKPHVVHIKINKSIRRMVRFSRTWGIYGIALVTPTIISMPVGTLICRAIEKNKWHIKLVMFFSLSFWSILIITLQNLFNIDVQAWFK
ncbi:MAG: hypothetical protein V4538_04395 [Bacteroidota bacterium]